MMSGRRVSFVTTIETAFVKPFTALVGILILFISYSICTPRSVVSPCHVDTGCTSRSRLYPSRGSIVSGASRTVSRLEVNRPPRLVSLRAPPSAHTCARRNGAISRNFFFRFRFPALESNTSLLGDAPTWVRWVRCPAMASRLTQGRRYPHPQIPRTARRKSSARRKGLD